MATTSEELQAAHDALSRDPEFQLELPIDPLREIERPPADSTGFLNDVIRSIGSFFSAIGPVLFWCLVALAVVLVLYVLFSIYKGIDDKRKRLVGRRRAAQTTDGLSDVDVRPDEVFANALLAQADALAEQGRFAEAVRILLHSSFTELQTRIRQRIGVSFTAREIGELGQMPDMARSAFHRLIQRVELSAFAEAPVNAEGYQQARQDYSEFALGESTA
ncbi:MAG: hypothetical protein CMK07_01580 [Ponticaulis sp.]|nr:hypothetical protein [Ponticaulis sp.]